MVGGAGPEGGRAPGGLEPWEGPGSLFSAAAGSGVPGVAVGVPVLSRCPGSRRCLRSLSSFTAAPVPAEDGAEPPHGQYRQRGTAPVGLRLAGAVRVTPGGGGRAGPCTGSGPATRDSCLLQLVELKNGETYNGHLVSCDNWMNINLREVICTSRVRPGPPVPVPGSRAGVTHPLCPREASLRVPDLRPCSWAGSAVAQRLSLPWKHDFCLNCKLNIVIYNSRNEGTRSPARSSGAAFCTAQKRRASVSPCGRVLGVGLGAAGWGATARAVMLSWVSQEWSPHLSRAVREARSASNTALTFINLLVSHPLTLHVKTEEPVVYPR